MKDFIAALGDQLEERAREKEQRSPSGRRSPSLRPRLLLAAALLAIAVVLGVALSPGSGPERAAAGLPVLERPVVDASRIAIAPELRRDGGRLEEARAFSTPVGRAYAIPRAHRGICLAIPDGNGGYAQTCSSEKDAARRGVPLAAAARRVGMQVPFAVILPRGATAPVISLPRGRSRLLAVHLGVAAGVVPVSSTVTYAVRGRRIRVRIAQPPPLRGRIDTRCPGGAVPLLPRGSAGHTSCR